MAASSVRRVVSAVLALCVVVFLACAGSASAAGGSGYLVTFVARACPAYTDIYANRARNDIMESLEDLGPDSPYPDSGFLVNPTVEESAPQDQCRPLPGWQFTLGTGIRANASIGPWGSLSSVTNPFSTSIETKSSTPLLNQSGQQIGNESLPGATTIELSSEERDQASHSSSLWAQGGTPTDPVLVGKFPGPQFAFGALRCATDALNGDNVEFIFFPAGVTHVFCYALYVEPPPTAGVITIKKVVTGAPSGDNPSFPFNGTISYDPGGFQLADGGSMDFFRAGGVTWDVTEGSIANYKPSSVKCTAVTTGGAPGRSTTQVSGSTTSIDLVAGEHVTCVYTNQYVPPAGGLAIIKVTRGAVGSFHYVVSPSSGHGASHHLRATTTIPGVPVDAEPSLVSLAPGGYSIRERPASSPGGRWRRVRVRCNGATEPRTGAVHVEVRSGEATTCTFVNAFTPSGSIAISKVTTGGTGTATFLIMPHSGPPAQYLQHATTTAEGVPVDAKPATDADATNHLRLGSYTLVEQTPPPSAAGGSWTLAFVQCNGEPVPFAQGAVTVRLTRDTPVAHCIFGDFFNPKPPPLPPVPPTPPSAGGISPPTNAVTDLALTKEALPPVVVLGQAVTYRITVRDLGPDPAQRVTLWDQPVHSAKLVSVHNPSGICQRSPRLLCQLKTLKPGARVVVTIVVVPLAVTPGFTNRAVVGSATDESRLKNNVAHATVRVIAPPAPPAGLG